MRFLRPKPPETRDFTRFLGPKPPETPRTRREKAQEVHSGGEGLLPGAGQDHHPELRVLSQAPEELGDVVPELIGKENHR